MARTNYQRKYYLANRPRLLRAMQRWKEKNPTYHRNKFLKRLYGIDLQTWDRLFKSQKHRCAICRTNKRGARNWSTDHDHKTKKVRGILCHFCNILLGMAKDNPKTLTAAIRYLKNHKLKEKQRVHRNKYQ